MWTILGSLAFYILGFLAAQRVAKAFWSWYDHPWRCWGFGVHWSGPSYRIIWCGWFTLTQDIERGWRGWKTSIFVD